MEKEDPQRDRTGDPAGPPASWKRTSRNSLQGDYDVMQDGDIGEAPGRAPDGPGGRVTRSRSSPRFDTNAHRG